MVQKSIQETKPPCNAQVTAEKEFFFQADIFRYCIWITLIDEHSLFDVYAKLKCLLKL